MNVQLIDITKHPRLDVVNYNQDTSHIFAGHIVQVRGVNDDVSPKDYFRSKEAILQALANDTLKVIWVNHSEDIKEFSVKITGKENIKQFVKNYTDYLGKGSYFLVCDDIKHIYHSNTGTDKVFYAIDTKEQLSDDFQLWKAH